MKLTEKIALVMLLIGTSLVTVGCITFLGDFLKLAGFTPAKLLILGLTSMATAYIVAYVSYR